MKRINWRSEAARYTTIGAFFGMLFPVVALLVMTLISKNVTILFGVICTAPFFLGSVARLAGLRQDRLNETNRGLERLVAERTSSIQSMLDLSGQGFLSFGRDFVVNPEYSRECERIFDGPIRGRRVDELFFDEPEDAAEFVRGISLFFEGNAKPEVIFDLLEHSFHINGKAVHADYRAVTNERIMVTLTDVTEELRLKERVRAEDERNARVLLAMRHKPEFGEFIRSAERVLWNLEAAESDPAVLLREVHTFKGTAGFFGFVGTQAVAHEIEDSIAESSILDQSMSLDGKLEQLKEIYAGELGDIETVLGNDWIRQADSIVIPKREYLRIQSHVSRRHPDDAPLLQTLNTYRKRPFAELFGRFPEMASSLALQRGKRIKPVRVVGGEESVVPERYGRVVSSFTHLVRNMVDHGIEPAAEREQIGKEPEGTIGISIEQVDRRFVVRFSDDGRGIDLKQIEERARGLGLLTSGEKATAARLMDILFSDGFSTSTSTTMVSGRGVGLAEVREAVREVGGKIQVSTKAGQGTTFTITLPGVNTRSKKK